MWQGRAALPRPNTRSNGVHGGLIDANTSESVEIRNHDRGLPVVMHLQPEWCFDALMNQ
jgi:hypothetical protein